MLLVVGILYSGCLHTFACRPPSFLHGLLGLTGACACMPPDTLHLSVVLAPMSHARVKGSSERRLVSLWCMTLSWPCPRAPVALLHNGCPCFYVVSDPPCLFVYLLLVDSVLIYNFSFS